ncbi:MAG: MBL fold metallo-hydrolase [Deltaproteobacteria bacterium]|nr:MBL fold metallo-hydrolase [Deltaproteobacteria bacterium]
MIIRSWGSRGSIPVSGKEHIKYGGDTTCIEVTSSEGDTLIIDAGTGIRKLGNKLVQNDKKINIIFTHPHWDHLSGFPFFKPLYQEGRSIEVRGPRTTQESVKQIISHTMAPPFFPIDLDDIHADISFHSTGPENFQMGSLYIKTIPINHTSKGVGYRIEEGGKSFVFLTDNELGHSHPYGLASGDYKKFAEGADVLFHDAEYTPDDYKDVKGWGHSVYLDALELAHSSGVMEFGLFHHNQDRDDIGIDALVSDCERITKEKSLSMKCYGVSCETEIKL